MTEAELMQKLAVMSRQERIMLGRAGKMAGMNQIEFQKLLASRSIWIHCDVAEYEADLKSLRENGWR